MWIKGRTTICLPQPSAICSCIGPRILSASPIAHQLRRISRSSISQEQTTTAGEDNCFKVWLKNRGEDEACLALTLGISLHGRGLFASRPITAGEQILRISRHSIITPDKLHDEVKYLLHRDVSNPARLALFILAEQNAGEASQWAPYINCLPELGGLHNTVLWSDDDLEMLRQSSSAYRQSIQSRAMILQEFTAVEHVFKECPHVFGQRGTCANFLHAYAVVNSRAWKVAGGNTFGLVPFVDFLNHDASCQSFLCFEENDEYAEIFADRDYAYGEQVFINYGNYGNDILAVTYGFTVEFNPYDQVEIWMGLPQKDALQKIKLELLHSHGMPTLSGFGGLKDIGNAFVIKEVKTIHGRGKGIPQSLRAFARVLCANTSAELRSMAREASKWDGRLARQPFNDSGKELQAMALLLSRVDSLIQQYAATIAGLKMESDSKVDVKSILCPRTKMVADILKNELRILHSAAGWLKHQCVALSSH